MGEGPTRKYGLLQDIILIAIAVCISSYLQEVLNTNRIVIMQNISIYYVAKQIIASLPLSGTDLEKEQHEQAQIKARTGAIPFSQGEYMLWEDHWVLCAQKLQQWEILQDFAPNEGANAVRFGRAVEFE